MFEMGLRWQVGNEEDIQFWHENWEFLIPLIDKVPNTICHNDSKVKDLFTRDKQWDNWKLLSRLHYDVVKGLINILIPSNLAVYKLCWGLLQVDLFLPNQDRSLARSKLSSLSRSSPPPPKFSIVGFGNLMFPLSQEYSLESL